MKRNRYLLLICVCFVHLLSAQTVVEVSGVISQNTTWYADKIYLLKGFVYVKNKAVLTIQPGTTIKGDKATKGALIVTRGCKIKADGTAAKPIVFTSSQLIPAPGDWGGVILLGYAPTNANTFGHSCLGQVEGGVNTPQNDAFYGGGDRPEGSDVNDNSGILRYVRIEYAGIEFQFNNEINGLTLAGVGKGTIIDYVQVSYSADDSFEWFGGTVNCKHLISYCAADDDFDFDLGYQGNVQFALAVRDPLMDNVSGSNGLEIDNDGSGTTATPKTSPTLSNLTIVGPSGSLIGDNFRRAAHLRRNCEAGIYNSVLTGNFPVGLFIDGVATVMNAQNGLLEIKNSRIAGPSELLKTTEQTFNINTWYSTGNWGNTTAPSATNLGLQDPFNVALPNAQPIYTSALRSGAAFNATRLSGTFFEHTGYIGAFSGDQDWTCQWSKFAAPNAACLVETDDIEKIISNISLAPTVAHGEPVTLSAILMDKTDLRIDIADMSGRIVSTPVQAAVTAGEHQFSLNTANLPVGLYFVRVQAGGGVKVLKMICGG